MQSIRSQFFTKNPKAWLRVFAVALLCFAPFFLRAQAAYAQENDTISEHEFTLCFRQNGTTIEADYLWNQSQIENLLHLLQRPNTVVDSVFIHAWASPEGRYDHNVWLSQKRSEAVRSFLLARTRLNPSVIVIEHREENWAGLRQAVSLFYEEGNKEEVMGILTSRALTDDERKQALIDLDGGKTYNYLVEKVMWPLRNAVIVVREKNCPLQTAVVNKAYVNGPVETLSRRSSPVVSQPFIWEEEEEEEYTKRTFFAVKTNALYDLLTIPNYAIEVPIGKHFSIQAEHYFPWWATKQELKYCLQYITAGGEFRWWFAPKPKPETDNRMLRDVLVGHYLGVYGLWGKADLQWERKVGLYQCNPILSAGLTYGYSFPLTKHWNMELQLSAGYARIPYQHYIPSEDWQILWKDREKQGVLHYVGPTQLKVSLVRPILIRRRVK